MKIIEQTHNIDYITLNPLNEIEKRARTCYKSEDKIGCTTLTKDEQEKCEYNIGDNCTNGWCDKHSSQKMVKMLIKNGHEAMLEFADMSVNFITNRSVTHELVRHRLCAYAQESQRYVSYRDEMEFIRPVWCSNPFQSDAEWVFKEACQRAENEYRELLYYGWRPEQSREVLPNAIKTEINCKTNLREWRHIFKLRCSKKAHPQIRNLMINLLNDVKEKIPVIFDDLNF